MAIEDLYKAYQGERMCPYYHQKMRLQEADVIFMPYNYLLDSGFREGLKLRMNRAILIVDEGHNIG
jgi:Rad3-related DNA helicase